jgi:outer membrane protein assembly factor BamB
MTGESVAGVAADDGRLLWRCPRRSSTAPVPTPIVADDCVYVTSGYRAGCLLLRLTAHGKDVNCAELHKNMNMVNHHGGALLTNGNVYGYDDNKGLICQDWRTTDVVWKQKDYDALWDKEHNRGVFCKMSLTCADGQLYCYGEDDGTVLLIEATPKGLKENGRFTIPEHSRMKRNSGKIWTHPVVADSKLYLRDQELIFCYDVKAP